MLTTEGHVMRILSVRFTGIDLERPSFIPLIFFVFIITLFFTHSLSLAGEYHATSEETQTGSETLACSQCHTMHGSQGGQSLLYEGSGTYPKLLRASSILNLCKYCHGENNPGPVGWDSRTPPQVFNNQLGYIPSGGDFKDRNYASERNRHSVGTDVSSLPPPGYTGTWSDVTSKFSAEFNCLYCHDQHGNTNFRNLRYDPGDPANDSPTSPNRVEVTYAYNPSSDPNDNTKDVNYWGAGADTSPENKFTRTRVRFRRSPVDNDSPARGIAAWCGKCHVQFYGASGASNMGGTSSSGGVGAGDDNSSSSSPWIRHPVTDMNLTTATSNLHADLSNWSGVSGRVRHIDPDGTPGNGDDEPFCLTCHYAHGGGNPNNATDPTLDHSNLVMVDGSGTINLDSSYSTSSGRMRNVCQQCHNQ